MQVVYTRCVSKRLEVMNKKRVEALKRVTKWEPWDQTVDTAAADDGQNESKYEMESDSTSVSEEMVSHKLSLLLAFDELPTCFFPPTPYDFSPLPPLFACTSSPPPCSPTGFGR